MEQEPTGIILAGPNTLLREGLARILSGAKFRILASTSCLDDPLLSSLPHEQPMLLLIDVSDDFDSALTKIESFKQRCPAGRVAVLAPQYKLTDLASAFRVGANAYFAKVATCDTFIKSLELVMLGQTILPPAILPLIFDQMDVSHNHTAAGEREGNDRHTRDGDVKDHVDDNEDDNQGDDGDSDYDSDNSKMLAIDIGTYTKSPVVKGNTPRLTPRQESILSCLIKGDSNKTIARKMKIAEATVKVHVKAILRRTRLHNRTQAAIWAMINAQATPAGGDDDLPALPILPVKPSARIALGAVQNNGSASSGEDKLQRGRHAGLASIANLVRKR